MFKLNYVLFLVPIYCILIFYTLTNNEMMPFGFFLFCFICTSFIVFKSPNNILLWIYCIVYSVTFPFGLLIIETKLNTLLFFLIWILVFFVFICRLFFEFNLEVIYLLLVVISLFTSPSKLLTNIESNIVSCLIYSSLLHLICIPNNKRFSLYKPIKRVKRKLNKVKSS